MTAKQFDKQVKAIVDRCPLIKKDNSYQYQVQTPAGLWKFSLAWSPRIKVAHLHSRFEYYNSDEFNVVFSGFGANEYTKKWNTYDSDHQNILDMFEEIVGNLVYVRLEYLRGELKAERISYEELIELQSLTPYIESNDVELLEAAGVGETI